MILKKRALKAYQAQLNKFPLQRPKSINLPEHQHAHNHQNLDFNEESLNNYKQWYMLEESNNPKKENSNYARYRQLAVLDIGLKITFGLIIFILIIHAVFF